MCRSGKGAGDNRPSRSERGISRCFNGIVNVSSVEKDWDGSVLSPRSLQKTDVPATGNIRVGS